MANYYVLLTDYGKSFIANAQAGSQLALMDVVLGDANDQPYLPDSRLTQTSLVNQRAKVAVTSIKIVNDTTAEVSAIVPSNIGGFNLHEVGIVDSSGKLVYVGNFHGGYRPTLTEGAGGDMELVFTIKADNLATVVIEMDGNVTTATRSWVEDRFQLLLRPLIPYGYKYWSTTPENPKVLFDQLLGLETFWRRLDGVHLVSVDDTDKNINLSSMYVGIKGAVIPSSNEPDHYQGYTSYLWERYDPEFSSIRYDGQQKYDGTATYQ